MTKTEKVSLILVTIALVVAIINGVYRSVNMPPIPPVDCKKLGDTELMYIPARCIKELTQ